MKNKLLLFSSLLFLLTACTPQSSSSTETTVPSSEPKSEPGTEQQDRLIIDGEVVKTERKESEFGFSIELPVEMEMEDIVSNGEFVKIKTEGSSSKFNDIVFYISEEKTISRRHYEAIEELAAMQEEITDSEYNKGWDYVYHLYSTDQEGVVAYRFVKFIDDERYIDLTAGTDKENFLDTLEEVIFQIANTVEYKGTFITP